MRRGRDAGVGEAWKEIRETEMEKRAKERWR